MMPQSEERIRHENQARRYRNEFRDVVDAIAAPSIFHPNG